MMRSPKGFRDKIVRVASGGLEAISLSIRDLKEDVKAFGRETYREVLEALASVVKGAPRVDTREVSKPTSHEIPARFIA